MSVEANKALVQRFIEEVYNRGNLDVLPPVPPGPQNVKHHVKAWRSAFPDLRVTVEDLVAEGNKVVYRWTIRGTHQGTFMGAPGTGKEVTASGIVILQVEDDRFVELWQSYDRLGFLQQLGALSQT